MKFHFIAIACPSPLLSNEAGSTPWPDNICDTSNQRRFFGGCNSSCTGRINGKLNSRRCEQNA